MIGISGKWLESLECYIQTCYVKDEVKDKLSNIKRSENRAYQAVCSSQKYPKVNSKYWPYLGNLSFIILGHHYIILCHIASILYGIFIILDYIVSLLRNVVS